MSNDKNNGRGPSSLWNSTKVAGRSPQSVRCPCWKASTRRKLRARHEGEPAQLKMDKRMNFIWCEGLRSNWIPKLQHGLHARQNHQIEKPPSKVQALRTFCTDSRGEAPPRAILFGALARGRATSFLGLPGRFAYRGPRCLAIAMKRAPVPF